MGNYTYETCCVQSTYEAINAMRGVERKVTYRTMLRHCVGLIEWAVGVGYSRRVNMGHGVTLRLDPYVSYHKSTYRGRSCYYLVWSGVEYIWVDQAQPNLR
jgi:hypothetical protein